MKILLDECVDQRLRLQLTEYECQTAVFAGFSGFKNGALLQTAEEAGFDVLITTDQQIPSQQNLKARRIAIIILCAPENRLADLTALVPHVAVTLGKVRAGAVIRIGDSSSR